jgi:hypothetical protein
VSPFVSCALCPNTGGAKKVTDDGRWCHVSCALVIPETRFGDTATLEPVTNIGKITQARSKLVCSLCHIRSGFCIQCSHGRCPTAYHITCASSAGLCIKYTCSTNNHVRLSSFCVKHSPITKATHSIHENINIVKKQIQACQVNMSPSSQPPSVPPVQRADHMPSSSSQPTDGHPTHYSSKSMSCTPSIPPVIPVQNLALFKILITAMASTFPGCWFTDDAISALFNNLIDPYRHVRQLLPQFSKFSVMPLMKDVIESAHSRRMLFPTSSPLSTLTIHTGFVYTWR